MFYTSPEKILSEKTIDNVLSVMLNPVHLLSTYFMVVLS